MRFPYVTMGLLMLLQGAITRPGVAQEAAPAPAGAPALPAAAGAGTGGGLAEFLDKEPKPAGPEADAPYAAIPPEYDHAVRLIAMDNFTSAAAELMPLYEKAKPGEDKARAAMWLGIAHGLYATTYPNTGWEAGTSASAYLREAMHTDPKVIEAPDACRVMAEMVAMGWGNEDPATALNRAEAKAEETRRPLDFYFAGVISRRLSQRAWGYSDTTEQDKKTLALFAKAVARDPNRYESWSAYLPALMPAGMHDLATSESAKMYEHFKNLRTPLLADQGPAVLMLNCSSNRTMKGDYDFLTELGQQCPECPMPRFEIGMRAIESTVTMAMEMFPKMISDFESGKLKPTAREAGYYVSSLYKYAFLLQTKNQLDESLIWYKKVKELSPGYAEVNLNMGILLALKSDAETTGPKKLALLEESLKYVQEQEKYDFRGKSALKANEMRQQLRNVIYRLKTAMKDEKTTAAVAAGGA